MSKISTLFVCVESPTRRQQQENTDRFQSQPPHITSHHITSHHMRLTMTAKRTTTIPPVLSIVSLHLLLLCCVVPTASFAPHVQQLKQHHHHQHQQQRRQWSQQLSAAKKDTSDNSSSGVNFLDKGFNLLEQNLIPQGPLVATAKEGLKFVWQRMMAELAPQDKSGSYQRPSYDFDGSMELPLEPNRYAVYLGNPCPWCHRVRLTLNVKGIDKSLVSVTQLVDDPTKASRGGWILSPADPDPLFTAPDLRTVYDRLSGPTGSYEGRCTAPLLVDKRFRCIVSNESSDICRMLNDVQGGRDIDLVPDDLQEAIDETNEWVYTLLNNGVYQCGFSTTQRAYDKASANVRSGLDKANTILATQDFLCGDRFTEADIWLLPTALRFDGVYGPLFRAGGAHLRLQADYPHIFAWMKRCWNTVDGVRTSIDLPQANGSYYQQLFPLNPGGIIPTVVTPQSLGLED